MGLSYNMEVQTTYDKSMVPLTQLVNKIFMENLHISITLIASCKFRICIKYT